MPEGQTIRKRGRPFKDMSVYQTSTPPRNGVYYTVPEAVELLGVHRNTLHARLKDGTLRAKKIGAEWRIYRDTLYTESK